MTNSSSKSNSRHSSRSSESTSTSSRPLPNQHDEDLYERRSRSEDPREIARSSRSASRSPDRNTRSRSRSQRGVKRSISSSSSEAYKKRGVEAGRISPESGERSPSMSPLPPPSERRNSREIREASPRRSISRNSATPERTTRRISPSEQPSNREVSRSRSRSPSPERRRRRNDRSDSYRSRSRSRGRRDYRSRSRSSSRRRRNRRRYTPSRSYSRSRSPSPYRRRRSPSPRYRQRQNPRPNNCIGVFGMSYQTDERDIDDFFSGFGEIDTINLIRTPEGRSRGFAFVYFRHLEDAEAAVEESRGQILDGSEIRVDFSTTNRPHQRTPGQYMGDRGRRGGDRWSRRY